MGKGRMENWEGFGVGIENGVKGGVAIPQTLQQLSVNLGNYWCKK